ncbi:MAG: D-2-hydroxyacid dehydrogenase [Thermofilaceae archaeon]|nr:D-2-hydroxyacid dehydrogenase [Thermofilaceae archaeon]MCX8179871.1 D-2-hydroxyacid dehydrogenase [Thermofilaceae archaeon]MDW8004444.1 D-2-hydroxyacid dehydrogenase [Thermofilaceae archaeon]
MIDKVPEKAIEKLKNAGVEVTYIPGIEREALLEKIDEYDILVFRSRLRIDREIIDKGKRLKVLARYGVGLDNVDVEYALNKRISVVNASTASCVSVAELTLGLMIAASRNLYLHMSSVKNGRWSKGEYIGVELYGKTLGVIGFGRIGSRVGVYARAMGLEILAYDSRDVSREVGKLGGRQVGLEELLEESDVVSLHVPLTPRTYRMLNEKTLTLIKDGAILVNTSRGEVIDCRALLKHLDRLGGVAFDVLEEEPPRSQHLLELIKHPRVIVTPHIGAETREAMERVADELACSILEALKWQ